MPRWASRITLGITGVAAERLLDIDEAGAHAEGFDSVASFLAAWNRMYAKRGFGCDVNPWVWVVEFRVLKDHVQ